MSVALEETNMFTPMVIQMIRVGEESGSLDQMMLELATVFDSHVQSGVKRGLALLEPVLILAYGLYYWHYHYRHFDGYSFCQRSGGLSYRECAVVSTLRHELQF